jgi:hypothetical protein
MASLSGYMEVDTGFLQKTGCSPSGQTTGAFFHVLIRLFILVSIKAVNYFCCINLLQHSRCETNSIFVTAIFLRHWKVSNTFHYYKNTNKGIFY